MIECCLYLLAWAWCDKSVGGAWGAWSQWVGKCPSPYHWVSHWDHVPIWPHWLLHLALARDGRHENLSTQQLLLIDGTVLEACTKGFE